MSELTRPQLEKPRALSIHRAMPAFERAKHEPARIGSGLWLGEAIGVRRTAPTKEAA